MATIMSIKNFVQQRFPDDYVEVYYSEYGGTLVRWLPIDEEEPLEELEEEDGDLDVVALNQEIRAIIDATILQYAVENHQEISQIFDAELQRKQGNSGSTPPLHSAGP